VIALQPPPLSPFLFWAVLASTVGVWGAQSVAQLLTGEPLGEPVSDAGLLWLVAFELLILGLWVPVLRRRGWSLASVTTRASLGDVPRGVALYVMSFLCYWIFFDVARLVAPGLLEAARSVRMGGTASWGPVLALSIVNPVVEELIYLGFVANVLRRHGTAVALAASVLARVVVHLYQGPFWAVSHVPYGLVFGGFYLADRRLWPAIVAHGLADLASLAALVRAAG
jgi:uncharacterized protein